MNLWNILPDGYDTMPTIEYYQSEKKITDAVFVVFPGGGYSHLSKHEGEGYAKLFNSWGADAFVVKYSVEPLYFPAQLNDARRAIQFVREHANEYEVAENKVVAVGSSAGGHLAAMLSTYTDITMQPKGCTFSDTNYIPNYQVLCYPVIDLVNDNIVNYGSKINLLGCAVDNDLPFRLSPQLECDKNTPPAFIWHNEDDETVNVFNSLNYAKNLMQKSVPVELHIFPNGGHGIGIAPNMHSGQWTKLMFNWLHEMKFY